MGFLPQSGAERCYQLTGADDAECGVEIIEGLPRIGNPLAYAEEEELLETQWNIWIKLQISIDKRICDVYYIKS